jgi:TM2 domain-containing membrane protein YozV
MPSEGKKVGTALCLSILFGWLGADRFYLGYPTIGIFKLLTGGFFGLGWYVDIFMIALRIVGPAKGEKYKFQPGGNFQIRLPGPDLY